MLKMKVAKATDTVKIEKTTYIINNYFEDKTELEKAWLSIIARAEQNKIAKENS